MTFLYLLLILSSVINLIVFRYDFIPFFHSKFKHKYTKEKIISRDFNTLEKAILSASLKAIKSKKSLMVWKEPKSISERFFDYIIYAKGPKYRNVNFPRAFLMQGLSEYLIKIKDNQNSLNILKENFDKLITNSGEPTFVLDIVDQVPLGIVALNLNKVHPEKKYENFADIVFKLIERNFDENNIVLYRKNQKIMFYDTIGMIVPFLIKYHKSTKNKKAYDIAYNQVDFYIKYGIDKDTFIPSHAVHLKTKIKVGSSNWGRGIGWYYLGLKELFEFNGSFNKEYIGLSKLLLELKNKDQAWSQFPGSSDITDTSATTMFLYCLPDNSLNVEQNLISLNKFINTEGIIGQTSGDTYGANRYSSTFGKSELTQGMLLLLLSKKNH